MESAVYFPLDKELPLKWMRAYDFGDKKHNQRKKDTWQGVIKDCPYYTIDDVKVIQVTILTLNLTFDVGIYRNMKWSVLKGNVFTVLNENKDRIEFNVDDIEDILFTNTPYELSPAIDTTKHDAFTILADNAIVFLSQMKIDGVWIFYK
jgi:hypothetical protein